MSAITRHIESLGSRRASRPARIATTLVALVALACGVLLAEVVDSVFTSLGVMGAALVTLTMGWRAGCAAVLLYTLLSWLAVGGPGPTLELSGRGEALRLALFLPTGFFAVGVMELLCRVLSDLAERERASRVRAQTRADLISIASHELRNPITSIIGFSQRLARSADRDVSDAAKHILESGRHMLATIERFLTLARVESGQHVGELEPVVLNALLAEEARVQRERCTATNLIERYPGEPVVLVTDEQAIRHIVRNLLDNALKYGGGSEVTLALQLTQSEALVSISDRGPGVPEELRSTIFERFRRGERGGVDGVGLGLYISRELALQLGATLSCQSPPEGGAVFNLALPRSPNEEQ